MGLIGKKGKPTSRSLEQGSLAGFPLRRFCPTLRAEAPTAVLGSWVVSCGANLVDERVGR